LSAVDQAAIRSLARADSAPLATVKRSRDYITRRVLATSDALAITAAMAIALLVVTPSPHAGTQFALSLLALPFWIALFKLYRLYDRDSKRVSHSTVDDVPWLFHALLVGGLALWAYSKLAWPDRMQLVQIIAFVIIAMVGILFARASARGLITRWSPSERALLVGSGPAARRLVRKMRLHPEYGLDPIGYLDSDEPNGDGDLDHEALHKIATSCEDLENGSIDGIVRLGDPESGLEWACRSEGVDRVILLQDLEDEELLEIARRCSDLEIKISLVPNLVEILGSSVEVDDLEGVTMLGVNPPMLTRSSRLIKRGLDVFLASAALLLTLPVMLLAALAIKLTSRGPVFFTQERIGRGERRFRLYKFRTMAVDAEEREAALRAESAHPAWLLLERDPRVTSVGRLLRPTSIDELPQLVNVIKGDMSLVGPRPMPPAVDEQIDGWGRRRLDLTPGITGLWQVLGRTSIPFEEMIGLDYLYVTNWSLWQDIRLLVRTLPAIAGRRGAN
jgi:exopolysaccharide biosynthesis polyprenyl glycosylphosphotransferase